VKAERFSLRRTWVIAEGGVREAGRERLFSIYLVLALGLAVGARGLRELNIGTSELKFLADCGFGAMGLLGAAVAVTITAQLFGGELERRTVFTLLAKPVGRAELVVGKYLSVVALLAGFCLLLTGLIAAMLWWRADELGRGLSDFPPNGRAINFAGVALAGFLQWLKLGVLAALVLLIASFARSQVFTILIGAVVFIICHLQHLVPGSSAGGWIAAAFPNFLLFSLADVAGPESSWAGIQPGFLIVYGAAYAVAAVALAVACFRRREL